MDAMQGLTALTIMEPCSSEGDDPYGSFKWDMCRLPALQELHLRGGNASWTSFLQAEDFTRECRVHLHGCSGWSGSVHAVHMQCHCI